MSARGMTSKALLSSLFVYSQFAVALAAAFFVTPLILRQISTRDYGLWLLNATLFAAIRNSQPVRVNAAQPIALPLFRTQPQATSHDPVA